MAEGGVVEGLVGSDSDDRDLEATAAADAVAATIAMDQAKFDPELSRKAGEYLEDQRALVRLEIKHFDEEHRLSIAAARRKRYADRIRNTIATLIALIILVVLVILAWMAWQASRDHGLVIDAFSVPPALAQDGLTGEVVAARFLDKLQGLQKATQSVRPARSFQHNWDSGVKLEIPETGMSFGEIEKLLYTKLGHASHIKGEVFRSATEVALTVRLDDEPSQTFTGPQSSLDDLAQKAAEAIYATSQPYRYADYLMGGGHTAAALKVISELASTGPQSERGWAYAQWANYDINDNGDAAAAMVHARRGLDFDTGSAVLAQVALLNAAVWSGHAEDEVADQKTLETYIRKRSSETTKAFYDVTNLIDAPYNAILKGDFKTAAQLWPLTPVEGDLFGMQQQAPALTATAYALAHDPAAAKRVDGIRDSTDDSSILKLDSFNAFTALPHYWISVAEQDWSAALADAQSCDSWLEANKAQLGALRLLQPVWIHPLEALAKAKTGDIAAAEALIATTPLDCYLCLRVRGQIAAEKRDWATAERWFAEAVHQAPTPPFAYTEWGQMRLAKGDLTGAISVFQSAHEKGPHFADPLKGWGDALARQGRWSEAQDRFNESLLYAPAWTALRQARDAAAAHLR